MLFRLTRGPLRYEGKWWAWPTLGAILTMFAVVIACFRLIGAVAPIDVTVERRGGPAGSARAADWRVTPREAAAARTAPPPADRLEVVFETPSARGEDLFVTLVGTPATVTGVDHFPMARRPAWLLVALSVALHAMQFVFPSHAWNDRYRGNLDAAAWRAEPEIAVHAQEAARALGLR